MSITHDRLPLINEGFAFKKAGERITHSEWNAVLETFAKCYNNLVLDTDKTANAVLTALADKSEQGHTHNTTDIKGLSSLITRMIVSVALSEYVTNEALNTKVSEALAHAKDSGQFNGTSATHSWNGTVLTVTSASGTSSADLKGDKGDKGDQGEQGIQGDKGETGATGATGNDGVSIVGTEINNKGELVITLSDNTVSNLGVVVGAKGDKGDTGATGATGATGDKGDKGDKGDQGEQGIQGIQGIQGVRGETGAKGDKGDTGEQGPKGDKGDKGDKGNDGADGKDGKDGKDGADYILTDDDKSEIAAQVSGDCVSYSEAQALTDEQKRTARENIGVNTTVSITDDGYGNITLNTSSKKVEFTDDGNGNIKMEVM